MNASASSTSHPPMTSKQAKAAQGKAFGLQMKEAHTKNRTTAQTARQGGSIAANGRGKGKGKSVSTKSGFRTLAADSEEDDPELDELEDEDEDMRDQSAATAAASGSDLEPEHDPFAEGDEEDDDETSHLTTKPKTRPIPDPPAPAQQHAADLPPPIPPKLLTRLLYEGFEDKEGLKIGREAMALVGKYVETFVREALARAALVRGGEDGQDRGRGMGSVGDGFLQVEDLEGIVAQLLMDF